MSVYLKCKVNSSSTVNIRGRDSASKPYIAVTYSTQTGPQVTDTARSCAYFPLVSSKNTDSDNIAVRLNSSEVQYLKQAASTMTTTSTSSYETSLYYWGTDQIGIGDPLYGTTVSMTKHAQSSNYPLPQKESCMWIMADDLNMESEVLQNVYTVVPQLSQSVRVFASWIRTTSEATSSTITFAGTVNRVQHAAVSALFANNANEYRAFPYTSNTAYMMKLAHISSISSTLVTTSSRQATQGGYIYSTRYSSADYVRAYDCKLYSSHETHTVYSSAQNNTCYNASSGTVIETYTETIPVPETTTTSYTRTESYSAGYSGIALTANTSDYVTSVSGYQHLAYRRSDRIISGGERMLAVQVPYYQIPCTASDVLTSAASSSFIIKAGARFEISNSSCSTRAVSIFTQHNVPYVAAVGRITDAYVTDMTVTEGQEWKQLCTYNNLLMSMHLTTVVSESQSSATNQNTVSVSATWAYDCTLYSNGTLTTLYSSASNRTCSDTSPSFTITETMTETIPYPDI